MKSFRVSSVVKDANGYNFLCVDGPVFFLSYNQVTGYIMPIEKECFSFQYPILKIEGDSSLSQVEFDGIVIFDRKKHTSLERFINNFPVNKNLREDINKLSEPYRCGLAYLYYNRTIGDNAYLQYLSFLYWLNRCALDLYTRYQVLSFTLNSKWGAEYIPKRDEYFDVLGVKGFDLLKEDEKELVLKFVEYVGMLNIKVSLVHNRLNQIRDKRFFSNETIVMNYGIEAGIEDVYMSQDFLQRNKLVSFSDFFTKYLYV